MPTIFTHPFAYVRLAKNDVTFAIAFAFLFIAGGEFRGARRRMGAQ